MSDPLDMALVGGGGLTLGGVIIGAARWLGARNVAALDEALRSLRASDDELRTELRHLRDTASSIGALDETLKSLRDAVQELHKEVRHLRETDLMQGKDIGSLQQEVKGLKERVDGQAEYWHKQFEQVMPRRRKS